MQHGQSLARQKTIAAWLYLISLQYYVAQLVVAAAWNAKPGYSWGNNTISDLANTVCGPYGSRQVCSPLHSWMNASFFVLGLTMAGGALLLSRALSANRLARAGFVSLMIAGLGTIIVGLFPENTISAWHIFGASLPFFLGNLAMILLAMNLSWQARWLRNYTLLSGVVGLFALGFFISNHYLGLGLGGLERVVSYPQSLWMMTFGGYLLVQAKRSSHE